MMKDGQMTIRDVIVDTMNRIGIGDDSYQNLRDALGLMPNEVQDIPVPDAVTTEHAGKL